MRFHYQKHKTLIVKTNLKKVMVDLMKSNFIHFVQVLGLVSTLTFITFQT